MAETEVLIGHDSRLTVEREAADPAPSLAALSTNQARRIAVVSGLKSDAHTWNLVFLQLYLEGAGFGVVNLGPCVTPHLLAAACREHRPTIVVLSSVNGHGYQDGLGAIGVLRSWPELKETPVVIGGKLGTSGDFSSEQLAELLTAGFDAVYDDGADAPARFGSLISSLAAVQA